MTEFRVKGDAIEGLKGFAKDTHVHARLVAVNAVRRKDPSKYEIAVRFWRVLTKQRATLSCVVAPGKELPIGDVAYKPTLEYCKEYGELYEER